MSAAQVAMLEHQAQLAREKTIEALATLADLADRVGANLRKLDGDNLRVETHWWNEHSQGLGGSALRAERALAQYRTVLDLLFISNQIEAREAGQ